MPLKEFSFGFEKVKEKFPPKIFGKRKTKKDFYWAPLGPFLFSRPKNPQLFKNEIKSFKFFSPKKNQYKGRRI